MACRTFPTAGAVIVLAVLAGPARAGDAVQTSGDVLRAALPATAFALTYYYEDPQARWPFVQAFVTSASTTWLLKRVIEDERPDGSDNRAFPSGHTSMAFQSAGFIHRRYGFDIAWPAYLAAAYTGWTRIDADKHDEADVLAGAALGIAVSWLIVDERHSVNVGLLDQGLGIRVSGRF